MSFAILGIGTALPEHHIEQGDAARAAAALTGEGPDRERLLTRLFRQSGVERRYSVLLGAPAVEGEPPRQTFYAPGGSESRGPSTAERMDRYAVEAPRLASAAARQALAEGEVQAGDVTHLVSVSCTGLGAPGFDLALIRDLGLPAGTARTHLSFMGCHGALNGLRVARAFAESVPRACVLVCAVELCSLHYRYGIHAEDIVANALFADGAAAVVGRAGGADRSGADGGARRGGMTVGTNGWRVVANGSAVLPDSEDAMGWHVGDHGFRMTLSPQVPQLIDRHLRGWLTEWLAGFRLQIADVGTWAVHPGGPRILSACSEALALENAALDESRRVLAEFGNMSSPTILFILDRLRRRGAPRPCVLLGFGPGLTVEAALVR